MPADRFFVTGTDTGVGKTVVSTVLAVGLGARYWKPIQTGTIEDSDSKFLADWIGTERIFPEAYTFKDPLSPHAASANEGVEISFDRVLRSAPDSREPLIVEGAGGTLVPINAQSKMIDLMKALELPVIVVSRSSLGTINHTLLTLEALRSRKIPVHGVVMVGERNDSNRNAIETYGNTRVLGQIPHCAKFSEDWFRVTFLEMKDLCKTTSA